MFKENKEGVMWIKFSVIVLNVILKELLVMKYIIVLDTKFFLVK